MTSGNAETRRGATRAAALRILAGILLSLMLGNAGASLVAETWLAPRCAAYAAAHGIDYDGVLLKYLKKRKIAARLSPCLFSDRTPAKGEVPVRWRELDGVSFATRLGVEPMLMTLLFGGLLVAGWLMFSPAGIAYRRRAGGAG